MDERTAHSSTDLFTHLPRVWNLGQAIPSFKLKPSILLLSPFLSPNFKSASIWSSSLLEHVVAFWWHTRKLGTKSARLQVWKKIQWRVGLHVNSLPNFINAIHICYLYQPFKDLTLGYPIGWSLTVLETYAVHHRQIDFVGAGLPIRDV